MSQVGQIHELHPLPIPQAPYLDGPILLRDGHPAYLRQAQPEDQEKVEALIDRCSAVSQALHFFRDLERDSASIARKLISPGNEVPGISLVVTIGSGPTSRVVGIGSSFQRENQKSAEVAFLVEDAYQGKGIGTLLVERLAMAAAEAGLNYLEAYVMPDNRQMLDVFRDSGFQVERELAEGSWYIRLPLVTTEAGIARMEERDRLSTRASLYPFFHPRAVAVIGASRNPKSIGYQVLANLIQSGFQGPVYPVNPNADYVMSIPTYKSVKDIPRQVDLAVVVVPQPLVLDVVDECAEKGVRALVVLSAGFAEVGEQGRELQDELVRRVRGAGMRMIGPNCLGLLHTHEAVQLDCTFSPTRALPGRVAMSSQSGALGLAILNYARDLGVGLSSFVSVGNKADVSGNDLLQWWEEDPNTDVILLYLESFGNPRRFARLARRIGRKKPIVAVKGGRTEAGQRAAGSHTAALAASDAGTEALFRQAGVIRTRTLEEMFDVAAVLSNQPVPPGNRVAILTNAGGPGILCADACESEGLVLPELSEETQARLREFLPAAAGVGNPVDMVASASADNYRRSLQILLEDENIDTVIVIFIPTGGPDADAVAQAIQEGRQAANQPHKTVAAVFMGGQLTADSPLRTGPEVIPAFRFPESAAIAIARAVEYAAWRSTPLGLIPDHPDIDIQAGRRICRQALQERGEGWLTPDEVSALLRAFGLPVPESRVATTVEEAVAAAEAIGYPVVVKLVSKTLVHKTEWNGVHLNIHDADGVRKAFEAIQETLRQHDRLHEMDGVLIQPMIGEGTEVFVGVTQDPMFGPLVAFGLGGVNVEVLGDVTFRITPLTDRDAREMVRSIRGYKLLEGYREMPASDVAAAEDILLRISRLVEEVQEIAEIDLNPVRLYEPGKGAVILDARVLVRHDPQAPKHFSRQAAQYAADQPSVE